MDDERIQKFLNVYRNRPAAADDFTKPDEAARISNEWLDQCHVMWVCIPEDLRTKFFQQIESALHGILVERWKLHP